MKRILTLLALSGALAGATAATDNLSVSFRQSMPSDFVIKTFSESNLHADYYTTKYSLQNGWHRHSITDDETMNSNGTYALLSPARLADGSAPNTWLFTPQIEVKEGTALVWTAKSVHDYARDTYHIMISENGSTELEDLALLASIEQEEYFLTRHYIDLSAYAGKTVRIAFAHVNSDGYILALDNINIGVPAFGFDAENTGHRFFGRADEQVLEYNIISFGGKAGTTLKGFQIEDADGNVLSKVDSDSELTAGNSIVVTFPFNLEVGTFKNTVLKAVYADGSTEKICSDFVNVSEFRRTVAVEKFTATWCNNCPKVMLPAHKYLHALGKDALYIEPHVLNTIGSDRNQLPSYIYPINYNVGGDYPALMINRAYKQDSWKPADTSCFTKGIQMPCTVKVNLFIDSYDYNHITAKATFVSAEDIDNTSGNYRVGFTILEKNVPIEYDASQQTSNMSGSTMWLYGESNFLPAKFPRDITMFTNVVRGTDDAATGIEGSLPAQIKAGEEYEVLLDIDLPSNVKDPKNLILASTANYWNKEQTGEGKAPILNATSKDLEYVEPSSVAAITVASADNGVYNLTGVRVADTTDNLPAGLYISGGKKVVVK